MAGGILSKEILKRFRASSRERLATVEEAWRALSTGLMDEARAAEMHRHVHTLKGDARIVSFAQIAVLCQALEDLLSISGEMSYRVPDEIDVLVTQALDFIGLLLRHDAGEGMPGIDVDSFVQRVEQVVSSSGRGVISSSVPVPPRASQKPNRDSLTDATRDRFAVAATNAFLEYLNAPGPSRTRLRSVWIGIQRELLRLDSTSVASVIERHKAAAPKLAESLGKNIRVASTVSSRLRVSREAGDALDVALLHLIRNAVDHGIEAPATRRSLGKSETGVVTLAAHEDGASIAITIRDDGRGLDLEAIRNRAAAEGLLAPDKAKDASPLELTELLFRSGFTTRARADDVSGRGVGLDAVRDAVMGAGGTIMLKSSHDGTNVTVRLPNASREVDVFRFPAFGGRVSMAISAQWRFRVLELGRQRGGLVDPFERLGLRAPMDETGMTSTRTPTVIEFESPETGQRLNVVAAAGPERAVGHRICPTPAEHPVEVISVGGAEVLMIRPEHLR